jgi:hypothetical protein
LQVLAVESRDPVIIDGVLDDSAWRLAPPVSGFIQAEPYEGKPATEDTEVRVAFDSKNLYIAAVCHDRGRSGVVVNDIREDFPREANSFGLSWTRCTTRNGFVFMTNPEARATSRWRTRARKASWDTAVRCDQPFGRGLDRGDRHPFQRASLRPRAHPGHQFLPTYPAEKRDRLPVPVRGPPCPEPWRGLSASARPARRTSVKPYVAGSAVRPAGGESFSRWKRRSRRQVRHHRALT